MLQYTLKRTAYSILIMFGVLLVTFLMFRLAAGDPTETLLGKNPMPQEIEEMRSSLGADKPLFWGKWRKTELFTSADFTNGRTVFPGLTYDGTFTESENGIIINTRATICFRRNFESQDKIVKIRINTESEISINGALFSPENNVIEIELSDLPEFITLSTLSDSVKLYSVEFFRPTSHIFDSQVLVAFREFVSFKASFPYISFMNFGKTLQTRESIRSKLWRGMFPSLCLMLPIFFGELFIGIALAMFSCIKRGTLTDKFIMVLSVAGMSISYLALIIFGQWFFAYYLNLFPVWGWGDPRHLALPVIIGIISGTGSGVRFYRTVFLNEINKEYLRTALAKGCAPFTVYSKHLLKNGMIPIITRASTVLPFLFTGSLLLESFFGIPGLGYEGINALNDADLQMLKALVVLGAFLFVFINLITDLAYAWVDPRVRVNK